MQKSSKASFRAGLVRSDTDVGASRTGADVSVGCPQNCVARNPATQRNTRNSV